MIVAPMLANPGPWRLLVGTYGPGVFAASLNPATGAIDAPRLDVRCPDPSFLALSRDGKRLVAALESRNEVASFAASDEGWSERARASSGGRGPCHLAFDAAEERVLVANYGDGVIAALPIARDGTLNGAPTLAPNSGHGPDSARQEAPHGHFVAEHGGFVYACDLGTDEIRVFRAGDFHPLTSARVPAGAGSRHLAFSGRFVFAVNEMGLSISSFARDEKLGALRPIVTAPLLEGDSPPGSNGAEIAIDPQGRYVFVSVRRADLLVAFRIELEGGLVRIGAFAAGVKEVRSFAISPDGRWVVAAGQESRDLASLPLDPATGRLSLPVARVSVEGARPVCVAFAP